ncbi:UNVERIFIED_CONTAM: hypothetical protein K2H54_050813 [Gekko kuhli]
MKMAFETGAEENPADNIAVITIINTEQGYITLEQFKELLINEIRQAAKEACKKYVQKLQKDDLQPINKEVTTSYQLTNKEEITSSQCIYELLTKNKENNQRKKIQDILSTPLKKKWNASRQKNQGKKSRRQTERGRLTKKKVWKGLSRKGQKADKEKVKRSSRKNNKKNKLFKSVPVDPKRQAAGKKIREHKGKRHLALKG